MRKAWQGPPQPAVRGDFRWLFRIGSLGHHTAGAGEEHLSAFPLAVIFSLHDFTFSLHESNPFGDWQHLSLDYPGIKWVLDIVRRRPEIPFFPCHHPPGIWYLNFAVFTCVTTDMIPVRMRYDDQIDLDWLYACFL
jgi:hypothetical protein